MHCGQDMNVRVGEDETALHVACACGYIDTITLLLKFRVTVDIQDGEAARCILLHVAC